MSFQSKGVFGLIFVIFLNTPVLVSAPAFAGCTEVTAALVRLEIPIERQRAFWRDAPGAGDHDFWENPATGAALSGDLDQIVAIAQESEAGGTAVWSHVGELTQVIERVQVIGDDLWIESFSARDHISTLVDQLIRLASRTRTIALEFFTPRILKTLIAMSISDLDGPYAPNRGARGTPVPPDPGPILAQLERIATRDEAVRQRVRRAFADFAAEAVSRSRGESLSANQRGAFARLAERFRLGNNGNETWAESIGARVVAPVDLAAPLTNVHQRRSLAFLQRDRFGKMRLFSRARDFAAGIPGFQSWLTMRTPQSARAVLEMAILRVGPRRSALDNALNDAVGFRSPQITDEVLQFYADEVADVALRILASPEFASDSAVQSLLAENRQRTRSRFIRRVEADARLGNECGDCTSVGSVNYGRSLTWTTNPGYQIMRVTRGGSFIGRINLTLADVAFNGGRLEPAIVIDAFEINPQAMDGRPLARLRAPALHDAMQDVRRIASAMGRRLFTTAISNADEIDHLSYIAPGTTPEFATSDVVIPIAEGPMRAVLGEADAGGTVQPFSEQLEPFFQMQGSAAVGVGTAPRAELTAQDRGFEREIVNPRQMADSEFGQRLTQATHAPTEAEFRAGMLVAAQRLIALAGVVSQVREFYRLSPSMGISAQFLATRLMRVFPHAQTRAPVSNQTVHLRVDLLPL